MKTLSIPITVLVLLAARTEAVAQGTLLAVSWTGGSSLIDASTGVPTPLGASGAASLNSLARHPSTGLYYTVSGSTLYTVDPTTGAATNTGVVLSTSDVRGMAITPAGVCYGIFNASPDQLRTIDLTTGIATLVGNTGSSSLQALASDPTGALYGWAVNPTAGGGGTLMTVNVLNGATTTIGSAIISVQALTFSTTGVLYGANTSLYTIDTTTAAFSSAGGGALGDIRGIEFVNQTPQSVSFSPPNTPLSPGNTLYVLYAAPNNPNEVFVPIVSCTLGAFSAPFLPQPLGVAWDACTDFYFNDPAGLAIFGLSGQPGSYAGFLDASGSAAGQVFCPAFFPAALNIPIHVTFVSWNASFVYTVHGVGTFVLY
jgi:hypothetical protein